MAQPLQQNLDAEYARQQQALDQQYLAGTQPAPARRALGEIGTGIARGAVVGLPELIGGAMKYASEPGDALYGYGQGMVDAAKARGQRPGLTLQPEQHGKVVNALASGGEMLAPIVPVVAAGIGAGALGAPALAATGVGALTGGALFGAEAGQRTLEKGRDAKLDEATAREAARMNAMATMAGQTALGMVGGQMLGTVGKTLGPMVGREGQALASRTLTELSGMGGVVAPFLKQMPLIAGEAVATNAAQAAASAQIERSYGVDTLSPGSAALESVAPTLGLTALLGPLALAGRALNTRAAQQRTATLADSYAQPELRQQLADSYAQQLAKVDPAAAENFRANAATAIQHKLPLEVDSRLLDPGSVTKPVEPKPEDTTAGPTTSLGAAPDGAPARPAAEPAFDPNWSTEPGAAPARPEGLDFTREVDTTALEIADLHGQIRQGLQAAGAEAAAPLTRAEFAALPEQQGKKKQALERAYRDYLGDPETARDLMRRDADAFDALRQEPAAAVIPDAPPDTQAPALPNAALENRAMADALTAAFKRADEDAAYAARATQKAHETEAIANIAKGAQLADAAEAGRIQGDPNAPKQRAAVIDDWKAAMAANDMDTKAQALVPFMKRLDTLGVMEKATHREQIDALQTIIDDKKIAQSQRDRAAMLKETWEKDMPAQEQPAVPAPNKAVELVRHAEQQVAAPPELAARPADTAALGENIPASAPDTAAMPPKTEAVADSLVSNLEGLGDVGVSVKADLVADRVAALRVQFSDRVRAGEQLSALETERMDDLAQLARAIDHYTEGRARPGNAQFVNDLAAMVDEASRPYTESLRMVLPELKMTDPQQRDMALLVPAMQTRKVSSIMEHLEVQGSEPWVRELAAQLRPLVPDTTIAPGTMHTPLEVQQGGRVSRVGVTGGEYDMAANHIDIWPRGATEETILHETVHAATAHGLREAAESGRPRNQQEARRKQAYADLEALREQALQTRNATKATGSPHYGLTNVFEFVAEAKASREFQHFLQDTGGSTKLWHRFVDAVRRVLGLEPRSTNLLDRALRLSDEFMTPRELAETFDASPEGAARATDITLRRVLDDADRKAFSVDTGRVGLATLSGTLPLQTVSYIAARMRALPEMVKSGFTAGVDAHQHANTSHDVVLNRLGDVGGKYTAAVNHMLRGMDAAKAAGVQREMATIGGEASLIGFDYRKNGRDNLASNAALDPADKAYMDEIHRRFTQLERSTPEAARLLQEGERLNLRILTEKTATIAANLLDSFAGRARHLEAELARMTPEDAAAARQSDAHKQATSDALLAERHARGLDLLDPTLAQGKNADAARWHDTSTSNLHIRLRAAIQDAKTLPENSPLRQALGALDAMYSAESAHPYFSLGRDGEFFVKVGFKGIDKATNDRIQQALAGSNKIVGDLTRGDSHAFFRVGTAAEAEALGKRLVDAGQGKVIESAWGRLSEKVHDAAGVSPALRTLLANVDDMRLDGLTVELREQVKEQLRRQMLSMLPETAARNASIGRRGIPGYDGDFAKQFAQRNAGAVHDIAGIYSSRAYADAALQRTEAIKELNRTGSADARQRAQLVDDEINKRYSNSLKSLPADWVSMANTLSYNFYLGLSPGFMIRTAAQPWHRGIPYIGSKFGFAGAVSELAAAQATGLKLVANSIAAATRADGLRGLKGAALDLDGLGALTPAERAWVQEAHENGKLGQGQGTQLMQEASGQGGKAEAMARYVSATTQYAELGNRFAMGLAAFRLASRNPKRLSAGETPASYAMRAMEFAMDDFSQSNTARAIGRHGWAGKVTPLFAQFQNYNLQFMSQIARTVHEGFFGQDKSADGLRRSSEARREFAGLMATSATLAGALGMPFADLFAGVYNTLMQDEDKPEDVRVSMRNWAAKVFGHELGAVLMKGLPAAVNLDSSTFGAQGVLPGTGFLADRAMWKERSEAQLRDSLGPAVSLGLDLANAVSKMSDGYWLKGIEAALPIGLRSFYKTGAMLAGDGYYSDSKGNPTSMRVGASDIAWRALGFQTEAKAAHDMAQREVIVNQQRLGDRRNRIQDQFIKGTVDPERMQDAGAALAAFNQANPLQAITGQDITGAIRQHYLRRALGEASGMDIPVTMRRFPTLQQDVPFAAMPGR